MELPQVPAILLFNLRASKNLACPQTVFLFVDSLRVREHFLFFLPPPPRTPLRMQSINPPRVLYPYASLTISKEKTKGLSTGY